ncbi:MAG TPA: phasin [Xanthobacteraceae bacterium]|jgi:phasin|nr:phasin [Xanthobacteraceae bacterium]
MAASDRFEVPPELRTFAEKSVEQARQAFDGFISAAHHAMCAFEGQAETARKGARDVTEKAMTFAERNMASAFAFAQDLVRARDLQEVLRLQADYIRRQMETMTEQARELGESTSKAAKDAAAPKD